MGLPLDSRYVSMCVIVYCSADAMLQLLLLTLSDCFRTAGWSYPTPATAAAPQGCGLSSALAIGSSMTLSLMRSFECVPVMLLWVLFALSLPQQSIPPTKLPLPPLISHHSIHHAYPPPPALILHPSIMMSPCILLAVLSNLLRLIPPPPLTLILSPHMIANICISSYRLPHTLRCVSVCTR